MSRPLLPDWRVVALTKELTAFDAADTGRRLRNALARQRAQSDVPDGMPPGGGDGSAGGSPQIIVTPKDDPSLEEGESVDVTGVELAVVRRQRRYGDPYHAACDRAGQAFERAARELDRCLNALEDLEKLDELRDDEAGRATGKLEPGCWAMARVDSWEPIFRRTEFNGREYALGRWAYDFLGRAGRLPTRDECERHGKGLQVRLPAQVVTRWQLSKV